MEVNEFEFQDLKIEALVDLRDQLTNVCSPKTDYSTQLLEVVDIALCKLINEQIINNKK